MIGYYWIKNIFLEKIKEDILMKTESLKGLKQMSKVVYIFAKIGKILVTIAIPFVILAMIGIALIINKIEYKDGEIKFNGGEKETLVLVKEVTEEGTELKIKIKDSNVFVASVKGEDKVEKIEKFFEENNQNKVLIFTETACVCAIVALILYRIMLAKIEKIFKNICNEDTPFIADNAKLLKSIAWLIIIASVVISMIDVFAELILRLDVNINYDISKVIEALIVFSMGYVFEYGYELQQESNGKADVKENEPINPQN